MRFRAVLLAAAGLALLPRAARADTQAQCTKGDCEYRFDDEGVNSPGWSAYADWLKVHPTAKRVTLIRPRVSFIMELVKSMNGI
jgi:hypothetical protein